MITVEKEEKIRKLYKQGRPKEEIAKLVGVSTHAVFRVIKMQKDIDSLSRKDIVLIVDLLERNIPVGAIEIRLKIPKSKIISVKRKYYLQKRKIENKCPTCGVVSIKECTIFPFTNLSRDKFHQLAFDIIEINNLSLIKHQLFFQIARQAKEAIEEEYEKKIAS